MVMKRTVIRIRKDATLEWLNPPPFAVPVVRRSKRRFSTIEPLDPTLRFFFKLLRLLFGETGKVSDWTRTWRVMWLARIKLGRWRGSEFVSPFRAACVEWEHERWEHQR